MGSKEGIVVVPGVLAVGCLWFQAYTLARAQGSWLAPGAMFSLYWALAIGLPLVFAPSHTVSATSLLYVVVGVTSFSVGAALASMGKVRTYNYTPLDETKLARFVTVASLLPALATAIRLNSQGFSLSDVLSIEGLFSVGNSLSVARYSGESAGTQLTSFLISFGYAGCILGPHLWVKKSRWRIWSWAPAASCTLYSVLTTERLVLLVAVALSAGGTIYAGAYLHREHLRLHARSVATIVSAALGTTLLFFAIAAVRVGQLDLNILTVLLRKLSIYAFGYLGGFSVWLSDYLNRTEMPSLGWGTASIAGVEYVTGQSRRDTRSYDSYVTLDDAGSQTNIYTIFRSLIIDFSEPGAIVALVALGTAATVVFMRAPHVGRPGISAIGAGITALLLLSNTMSVFTFTNVLLSLVWAGIALNLTQVRSRRIPKARL